jgi:DNA-binding PadR family transcriptional regulator
MTTDTQSIGKHVNELLVLAALRAGPKHGYQIALDVETETAGAFELQHGTLYPVLHRLEAEGLVKGRWTRAGGRRRKEYELTVAGRRHLGEAGGRLRESLEILFRMLEEAGDGPIRARPATS